VGRVGKIDFFLGKVYFLGKKCKKTICRSTSADAYYLKRNPDTVLCISVGPRPHWMETRVIIKISTLPCYPKTFDCFSWD
jgi:hypothetical protein